MARSALSRARLLLIAGLLLTSPFALILSGPAAAQTTCQESGPTADPVARWPIFITDVQPQPVDIADDSALTSNGAIFVEDGDEIEFTVRLVNRVPETCESTNYQGNRADDIALELYYLKTPDGKMGSIPDQVKDGAGRCGNLQNPGGSCTLTISLPSNGVQTPSSYPEGEQRVRFVATDDGNPRAGAERIMVVNVKPDLRPESIDWVSPSPANRHTVYPGGGESTSELEATVDNQGTYPLWNPNGGSDFVDNSSYDNRTDADGDLFPDLAQNQEYLWDEDTPQSNDLDDQKGPECPGGWINQKMPCSFRLGEPLDMPLSWEVSRENNNTVIESGVSDERVYSNDDSQDLSITKDTVPAWPGASGLAGFSGTSWTASFFALDRTWKAGDHDVTVIADRDEQGNSFTPETDENDNDLTETENVFGVDLEITSHGIHLKGSTRTCTDPKNPCQAGTSVIVSPEYANRGTPGCGNDGCQSGEYHEDEITGSGGPQWVGTVWLQIGNGPLHIAPTADGGNASTDLLPVPLEASSSIDLHSGGWEIPTNNSGGTHRLVIRLDHPANYNGSHDVQLGPRGLGSVAERGEDKSCPSSIQQADNTFCLTLHFKDTKAPRISDLTIDDQSKEEGVPTVVEGETVRFNATVEDNALENVTAFLNASDSDQQIKAPMTAVTEGEPLHTLKTSLNGTLGNWTFAVRAQDANFTSWATPMQFQLAELPKNITIGGDTEVNPDSLNGQATVVGPNAPRYQGTVEQPGNVFNLTVNITGTGRNEVEKGKFLDVHAPNGTRMAQRQMESILVCRLHQTVGAPGSGSSYGFGPECENPPAGTTAGSERWNWWYVNNSEERWQDLELAWVGTFNLTVNVTDTFNRTNTSDWQVRLQDKVNDNGLMQPNVTDVQAGPMALDPGDRFTVKAHAKDALRVDRVYLDLEKPGDDTQEANLSVAQLDADATNNGTYRGVFTAGAEGEVFDRAGTYTVSLVADDFGDHPNRTELGTVTVNDTREPTIEAFFSEPRDVQEVGGNVTWVARISDDTAIRPPELTVTRPGSGSETFTLVFNETDDRWVLPEPLTATAADVGTWSYELQVSDYADNLVTAQGSIEIEQNLPPRAQNFKPAIRGPEGILYGPAKPTISADVVDTQGVQRDSLTMSVNGKTVLENGSGAAQVAPIPSTCDGCYRITWTPSSAFRAGETVTVQVKAADRSDPPKVSGQQTHQFKVDKTPPSATIDMTPTLSGDGTQVIGATTDINVTVTDTGSGPGQARVTVEHLAGTTAATRQVVTFDDGTGSFRLQELSKAFQGHGRYRIAVEPTDAVGNTGERVVKQALFDDAPPKISTLPQLNKPRSFIEANVTDVSRIRDVVVKFSADGGPQHTLPLELTNGTWSGRIVNPDTDEPYPENTTVEFFVEATDFFGNVGSTNPDSFQAGNAVPSITIEKPQAGATLTGTVTVRWTASDPETSASELNISLWYKQDGGQPREIPSASDLDNVGRYQLDTTLLPNGELTLQAIVFDGSTFGADSVQVTVRNTGQAFRSPEVRGAERVDGANVVSPNEETVFTVQISGNVRTAWANVTQDGETIESYQLEDAGGGTWRASFTAPEEPGEYEIDLAALTADGAQRTKGAYAFTVQSAGESESFIPEWTVLTVLFAGALAVGAYGLTRRWS